MGSGTAIALLAIGTVFVLFGILHGVLKFLVIRSVAKSYDRGVPVLDFVIFVPLWLSFGISLILSGSHIQTFPFFGVVLYFGVAAILWTLMEIEFRRGKPYADAELAERKKRTLAEEQTLPGEDSSPDRSIDQ